MTETLPDDLAIEAATRIVFVVIDGLGGLRAEGRSGTELQEARTPNLDRLAERGICGVLDPVTPGVAPGSGPAHLALFGYDPLRWSIGRGVLSALGIDFDLQESDVAARANFATLDAEGRVVDRRAGRIDSETGAALCRRVLDGYVPPEGGEVFFEARQGVPCRSRPERGRAGPLGFGDGSAADWRAADSLSSAEQRR